MELTHMDLKGIAKGKDETGVLAGMLRFANILLVVGLALLIGSGAQFLTLKTEAASPRPTNEVPVNR